MKRALNFASELVEETYFEIAQRDAAQAHAGVLLQTHGGPIVPTAGVDEPF